MRINSFEDVKSWQYAKELTLLIYKIFEKNKDFGFKDQIQRASVSIMNNIAEGFDRISDREKIYFFNIAKGSSSEVKSMLYIAKELEYIDLKRYHQLHCNCVNISKLLYGLIKSIESKQATSDKRQET